MFGQNITEYYPALSPSGHPLLSGPPGKFTRFTPPSRGAKRTRDAMRTRQKAIRSLANLIANVTYLHSQLQHAYNGTCEPICTAAESLHSVSWSERCLSAACGGCSTCSTDALERLLHHAAGAQTIGFERVRYAATAAAEVRLSALASSIRGRVYVYEEFPFNWLATVELNQCMSLHSYASWKHAGDLHLAREMLNQPDHPWRTRVPETASLFIVPALLGMLDFCTWHPAECQPGVANRSAQELDVRCGPWLYSEMLTALRDALRTSPHLRRGVPHLLMSGGWSATVKMSQRDGWGSAPWWGFRSSDQMILGTFEKSTSFGGQMVVSDPYVYHVPSKLFAAILEAWQTPLATKPIALHFRGSIDSRLAYKDRVSTCQACHALDAAAAVGSIICTRAATSEGVAHGQRFPRCLRADLNRSQTLCTERADSTAFVQEVLQSRFLLTPHGDTPTTQRLYSAMAFGALPVAIAPGVMKSLETHIVGWYDFIVDATPSCSPGNSRAHGWGCEGSSQLPADRLESELRAVLRLPAAEQEARRHIMLWYLPYVAWTLARRTTAMYVLVQASQVHRARPTSETIKPPRSKREGGGNSKVRSPWQNNRSALYQGYFGRNS